MVCRSRQGNTCFQSGLAIGRATSIQRQDVLKFEFRANSCALLIDPFKPHQVISNGKRSGRRDTATGLAIFVTPTIFSIDNRLAITRVNGLDVFRTGMQ